MTKDYKEILKLEQVFIQNEVSGAIRDDTQRLIQALRPLMVQNDNIQKIMLFIAQKLDEL